MKLARFAVRGFAQLDDVELLFREGAPSLVFGPNEAGKSNLMEAFYGMFFPIDKPERFVPWDGPSIMSGVLEFVDRDGQHVCIERGLSGRDVTVTVEGREPWSAKVTGRTREAIAFAEHLDRWLGFREKDVFASTIFVRQANVIASELQGVAPEVRQIITGTVDADYEQVLADLTKQLDGLCKAPGARAARQLELKQSELEKLKEAYQAAVTAQETYAALQHERERVDLALKEKRCELDRQRKSLERIAKLVEAETKLTESEQQFKDIGGRRDKRARIEKQLQETEKKRDALAAIEPYDEVTLDRLQGAADARRQSVESLKRQVTAPEMDIAALTQLDAAVADVEAGLHGFPGGVESIDPVVLTRLERQIWESTPNTLAPRATVTSRTIVVTILCSLVLGLTLGLLLHTFVVAVVIIAAGIAVSAYLIARRHGSSAVGRPPATSSATAQARFQLEGQLSMLGATSVEDALRVLREYARARRAADEAYRQRDLRFRALGVASTDDARQLLSEYEESKRRLDEAEEELYTVLQAVGAMTVQEALDDRRQYVDAVNEIKGLRLALSEESGQDLEQRWGDARTTLVKQQGKVEELSNDEPALRALQSAEARARRAQQLQEEVDRLEEEVGGLDGRLAGLDRDLYVQAPGEDSALVFLQVDRVEAEIRQIERHVCALEIALQTMNESVEHFHENALGPVAERSSQLLKAITDGRYERVHLDGDELEPHVDMAARPLIPTTQLSRGLRDQLYFSLRIALTQQLAGGRTLPLVLDDPFVNFDSDRLERVMALLSTVARQTQVVLFTCDSQYLRWLEPVLTLTCREPASSVHASGQEIA